MHIIFRITEKVFLFLPIRNFCVSGYGVSHVVVGQSLSRVRAIRKDSSLCKVMGNFLAMKKAVRVEYSLRSISKSTHRNGL